MNKNAVIAAVVLVAAGTLFVWGDAFRPLGNLYRFLDEMPAPWMTKLFGMSGDYYRAGQALRFLIAFVPAAIALAYLVAAFAPGLSRPGAAALRSRLTTALPFVILPAAAALLWFRVYDGQPRNWDESTYLFQARIFASGRAYVELPPCEKYTDIPALQLIRKNKNFFFAPLEATRDGRWFSSYPPLYPLALAAALRLNFSWLLNPLLMAGAITVLYFVTRREYGAAVAGAGVVLAATSPFVIFNSATHLSEPLFVLLLAAFIFVLGTARGGWWRYIVAGALVGAASVTRELSTALLFVPFAVAHFIKPTRRLRRRDLAFFALGVAPFVIAYLTYNKLTTGSVWTPPRALTSIKHLYFGFDADFGPGNALASTFRELYDLNNVLFGWPLLSLVPLAVYALRRRPGRFAKTVFASLGVHLIVYFFARNTAQCYGPRYYLPLAMLFIPLTADAPRRLSGWLSERRRWAPARAATFVGTLIAAGICYNLMYFAPSLAAFLRDPPSEVGPGWMSPAVRAAVAACPYRPAAILISPAWACGPSMPNAPALDDDVILARDQGLRDADFFNAFPRRYVLYLDVTSDASAQVLTLIRTPREEAPP